MFATLVTLALLGVPCISSWSSSSAAWSATGEPPPVTSPGGPTARAPVTPRRPRARRSPRLSRSSSPPAAPDRRQPRPCRPRRRSRRCPGRSDAPSAAPASLTVGLGLHPERPVRAVLPRRPERRTTRDAGLTSRSRTRSTPTSSRCSARAPSTSATGDGTSVIPAVSQGIPIVYARPSTASSRRSCIAKADSGIKTAADLKGKKIGTPGQVRLVVDHAPGPPRVGEPDHRRRHDRRVSRTSARRPRSSRAPVDAATGLRQQRADPAQKAGIEPVVLTVDDIVPLPGPGLVTGTATLAASTTPSRRSPRRRCDAMDEIAADPQKGLDATFAARARPRQGPRAPAPDPRRHHRRLEEPADRRAVRGDRQRRLAGVARLHDPARPRAEPVTVDQLVDESLLP